MRRAWGLLLLFGFACTTTQATQPAALRVVATPVATAEPSVVVETPKATKKPVPSAPKAEPRTVSAAAAAPAIPLPIPAPHAAAAAPSVRSTTSIKAFGSLGSWVDVFDYKDDPKTIVPLIDKMADLGTKTLYLETARMSSETDIQFPKAVGAALDRAKARGMRAVAWYPPDFKDLKRDVRRSLAAINFRTASGNRFDAFGADIEYTAGVPDYKKRNALAIEYTKQLRKIAGNAYPLAAIVIPPTWLEISPKRWPDFPWAELAKSYNLFMPMNYWTARGKNPDNAYNLTKTDTQKTKALTGRPVHMIGGLGADADGPQVAAYVKAAREAGSIGGGLYDFTTTRGDVWDELRKLL